MYTGQYVSFTAVVLIACITSNDIFVLLGQEPENYSNTCELCTTVWNVTVKILSLISFTTDLLWSLLYYLQYHITQDNSL